MLYIYIQYMHVFVYTDTDIYVCMYVCTYSLLTFLQAKGLYMQHMFISGSSQVQDDSASSDGSGCESTDEGPKGNAGIKKTVQRMQARLPQKAKAQLLRLQRLQRVPRRPRLRRRRTRSQIKSKDDQGQQGQREERGV